MCTVDAGALELYDGSIIPLSGGKPDIAPVPGLFDAGDALYCVGSDGFMVRDTVFQGLRFGSDGRYTCGNAVIDAYVESVLASLTSRSMSREEKLRACYEDIYYNFDYQGNANHVPRAQDCKYWAESYMLRLIERGKGNCYCFAAKMYYLALRLGYPTARAISGAAIDEETDHGWLEIPIDGVRYICDPELEAKMYKGEDSPGRIFMKPYREAPWGYWLDP